MIEHIPSGLVLTLQDGELPGEEHVILDELREAEDGQEAQMWYLDDKCGVIRTPRNDYCISFTGTFTQQGVLMTSVESSGHPAMTTASASQVPSHNKAMSLFSFVFLSLCIYPDHRVALEELMFEFGLVYLLYFEVCLLFL